MAACHAEDPWLAPGTDWLTLHHAVTRVARRLTPFTMPPMQVQRIDDFLALVPMPSHQPTQPSTRQRQLASPTAAARGTPVWR